MSAERVMPKRVTVLMLVGLAIAQAQMCTLESTVTRAHQVAGHPSVRFEVGEMARIDTGNLCLNVISRSTPMGAVALDLRVRVEGDLITSKVLAESGRPFEVKSEQKQMTFKGTLTCQ